MKSSRLLLLVSIVFLFLIISGCGSSQATSSKASLSEKQALNMIASDLKHHGVNVQSLKVNKLNINKSENIATVEFIATFSNGTKETETVTFLMDHGEWRIQGHNH